MSSFQGLKALNAIQQRKAAAILGALLADSAMCPLHWIYDQNKVAQLVEKEDHPEFYPTSQCPYYTIATGNNSAYGDQLYVTLKNIAENKGFDDKKLADAFFEYFGPGTIYENARTQTGKPVKGPWTNHCMKIFIAKRENGEKPEADANSKDPDGLCKAVPVIALHSGKDSLSKEVTKCVQTIQSNDVALKYALLGASLLDNMIQTGEDNFKISTEPEIVAAVEEGRSNTKPHKEVVKKYGLACSYPASFLGVIDGICKATNFVDAVRSEIMAGGDNCSRGLFIGAYCGAKYGLDSIPQDWLSKYGKSEEVIGYIKIVAEL